MDTVVKALVAGMRAKDISIQDAGLCISLSFDGNVVLLNKLQISIVEVIKDDTVRIEMGNGATSSIFIKTTDVVDPVVIDANGLRNAIQAMLVVAAGGGGDGDCACAPLITQTNTELQNVVAAVNTGVAKADATAQVITGIYDNGQTLTQVISDNNAATIQKLTDIGTEVINTKTSINTGNTKLDTISQSVVGVSANVAATNQLLTDNQAATIQRLVDIKSEVVNAKASINAGNVQRDTLNQSVAGVSANVGTTNQLLYNNQVDNIQKLLDIKLEVVNAKSSINTGNAMMDTLNQSMSGVSANVGVGNQLLTSLDGKVGSNGFLGNISKKLKTVSVQPPISTVAYAVGQVIGGVMTLTGALRAAILSGTWTGVQVVEKSTQKAPMDIVIFSQNPTAANFLDHAAPVWTNDYGNIIGITNLVAANYSTLSTSSGACLGNLYKRINSTTGNLYAVAICNGTPTYASVSHLYFTFYFEQD
jgi:hypothetical protein